MDSSLLPRSDEGHSHLKDEKRRLTFRYGCRVACHTPHKTHYALNTVECGGPCINAPLSVQFDSTLKLMAESRIGRGLERTQSHANEERWQIL